MKPFHLENIVLKSLKWLDKHHKEEVQHTTNDAFFASCEYFDEDLFENLLEEYGYQIDFNYTEWLIADSIIDVDGMQMRTADLLLSENGPRYTFEEREMIKVIKENPLRLYEVVKTDHENGYLYLKDILQEGRGKSEVKVYDKKASMTTPKKMKIALRVIPWNGENILSRTAYIFLEKQIKSTVRQLKELQNTISKIDRGVQNFLFTTNLISAWFDSLLSDYSITSNATPQIIDSSTGEPLVITTDLFDIHDIKAFQAYVKSNQSIEREKENNWVYYASATDDGFVRIRGELILTEKKRLKVITNTIKKADELRAELEDALGKNIHYRTRKIEDVTSKKLLEEGSEKLGKSAKENEIDMNSPEILEMMQNYIHNIYKNWADEPIPALGNKTPRQTLKVKGGEKKVRELIETYELSARKQHVEDGNPLLSYDFLYEALGLKTK